MHTLSRCALLALALLTAGAARGQQQTPLPTLVDARQVLRDAADLHEQGNYPAAIAKYQTVTSGDSSYARTQSELALSYLANKQYAEAAAASKQAIALHLYEAQPYDILATAEENLGHVPEALRVYAEGLRLFPYNHMLWYNQGVTQKDNGRYPEAQASFERSLALKPTHAASHLLLGVLAAQQGQTAHAMLGLMTFLALSPEAAGSHDVLVALEQLATNALQFEDKEKVAPFVPNGPFQELDLLLTSKVALRKDYVSRVKVDASAVKQVQLLVEKFPAAGGPDEPDFWLRAYGPLVAALRRDDNLTPFTYLLLTSADDKKPAQWVKANNKKTEKMGEAAGAALNELRAYQTVQRQGQPARVKAWFNDAGQLNGLGDGDTKDGKVQLHGDWQFVDDEGYVSAAGRLSAAGNRTGAWRSYYPSGQLEKLTAHDDAGELDGPYKEYFDNGELSIEGTYRHGQPEGTARLYHYCGALRETRPYQGGSINGEAVFYYPNGKLQRRAAYKADKQEGPETAYYPDGTVEYRYQYAADQPQGPGEVFYANKQLEKKCVFDHGELHGPYTYYYTNGQVSSTGTYDHGQRTGPWHDFYASGQPSSDATYNAAGELHGPYLDYDRDGKRSSEYTYEQGHVVRTAYFDKAGKTLAQTAVAKKGATAVQGLWPDGTPHLTGTFVDGDMDGEWRWLHHDGTPATVTHYAHGRQDGLETKYFTNGQVKSRQQFRAGQAEGYFETFREDGQPRRAGFYRQGQQQGPWHDYYPDGRVSEVYHYLEGEINGVSLSYTPTGQLTQERRYEQGRLLLLTAYDSTGAVLNRVEVTPKLKGYALSYPNGKPLFKTDLNCYAETGTATWLSPVGKVEMTAAKYRDQRAGPYRAYHPNGQLAAEGTYRNGQPEGEWKTYFASGKPHSQGLFREGNQEGEWVGYFENGQVAHRTTYVEGELNGPLLTYNQSGELLMEKLYEDGNAVRYRSAGPDGRPTGAYLPVPVSGVVKTAFANGRPAVEETYRLGYFDGPRTSYYSTGQVYRRAQSQNGPADGRTHHLLPQRQAAGRRALPPRRAARPLPLLPPRRHPGARGNLPQRRESRSYGVL